MFKVIRRLLVSGGAVTECSASTAVIVSVLSVSSRMSDPYRFDSCTCSRARDNLFAADGPQNPAKVRVIAEADAEKIEYLPLIPIRGAPYAGHRIDLAIRFRHPAFQPKP